MTAEELKSARLRMGWTPEQLAAVCRVSVATVYSWETSRRAVPGPAEVLLGILETGQIPRPPIRGEPAYEQAPNYRRPRGSEKN